MGAGFEKVVPILLRKTLTVLLWHQAFLIFFICGKENYCLFRRVFSNLLLPGLFYIVEWSLFATIVAEDNASSAAEIHFCYVCESFLPRSIPHLKLDLILINLNFPALEVKTNCVSACWILIESVTAEFFNKTCLAHPAIAKYYNLYRTIVLVTTLIWRHHFIII